mmetsp:Transcript_481/g.801  ORF Transcript_481/g.801 Transcript_481/m.801 type:complete len:130 (-) Transcript_481:397-786(-)
MHSAVKFENARPNYCSYDSPILYFLLVARFSAAVINESKVIVFDGANGGDVSLFDGPSLDFETDTATRGDDHLFVVADPGISFPIESTKHVFGHGVFGNEYPQGSDKGKEAQGIALRYRRIQHFIDKGS